MLGNRINISVPLVVSLAAIGIGALVVMLYLFDIAAAVLGPGTGDIEPDAKLTSYVEKHDKDMQEYAARVDGRSVFYIPPIRQPEPTYTARNPEPKPQPVKTETTEAPPPPPPPPATYTGPTPIFAVGSEVWFEKPTRDDPMMRLRVGETAHGVKLVSVALPAIITVEFRGKEFELDLLGKQFAKDFLRDEVDEGLVTEPPTDEKPTPGIVIVSDKGETPQGANQPAVSASDLEQPAPTNSSGRPQPTPSDIAFEIDRPGETDEIAPDQTAPALGAQPGRAAAGMQEQPADEWYGPPIPEDLLALYSNATKLPERTNDSGAEAMTSSTADQESAPQPPRDLEAEDENATTDPEADAETQAASGDQPVETGPQPAPASSDDPDIPPE